MVSDINDQLLNNVSYYLQDDNCEGLSCTEAAGANATAVGIKKYPILLAEHLQLKSGNTIAYSGNDASFTTVDGNVWTFDNTNAGFTESSNYAVFQVDVNSEKSGSTLYSASSTKNIDTYKFRVNFNGSVEGYDSLTKAYLKNPHKLNDRKADYKSAKAIESSDK